MCPSTARRGRHKSPAEKRCESRAPWLGRGGGEGHRGWVVCTPGQSRQARAGEHPLYNEGLLCAYESQTSFQPAITFNHWLFCSSWKQVECLCIFWYSSLPRKRGVLASEKPRVLPRPVAEHGQHPSFLKEQFKPYAMTQACLPHLYSSYAIRPSDTLQWLLSSFGLGLSLWLSAFVLVVSLSTSHGLAARASNNKDLQCEWAQFQKRLCL